MVRAASAGDILSRFESEYSAVAAKRRIDVDPFFSGVRNSTQR